MEFDRRLKIRDNDRFYTAKVSQSQTDFFYKLSKTEEIAKQIKKQVNGVKLIDQILGTNEDSWLRAERIVYSGDEWLLAEWLDGGPLATPEQFLAGENLNAVDELVKIHVEFDKHAESNSTGIELRVGGTTLLKDARQKQTEKLEPLINQYGWDGELINLAINFWIDKSKAFTPALQHGDLTPWHVFRNKTGLVLIDCEHSSDDWPRYYDIANFYSALNTRFNLPDLANKMVNDFSNLRGFDLANQDGFIAVVLLRNIFRLHEHHEDVDIVNRIFEFTKKFLNN